MTGATSHDALSSNHDGLNDYPIEATIPNTSAISGVGRDDLAEQGTVQVPKVVGDPDRWRMALVTQREPPGSSSRPSGCWKYQASRNIGGHAHRVQFPHSMLPSTH